VLSQALESGLRDYEIGPKIRALRSGRKLSLQQLAKHTGLSPALLSKIERDQIFPTLPTLMRIAMVFGVGLEHFFVNTSDRPEIAVVRKKDRLRLPDRPGDEAPSFFFESLDFPVPNRKMEGYYAEFQNKARPSEPHVHPGNEIIYVLSGQLVVNVDGEDTILDEGDAMYFDSGFPHSYHRYGRGLCTAVVVVTRQDA
jgi:transcriptional regulator with XRE-family HTH domain